jgi:hypothetical protein
LDSIKNSPAKEKNKFIVEYLSNITQENINEDKIDFLLKKDCNNIKYKIDNKVIFEYTPSSIKLDTFKENNIKLNNYSQIFLSSEVNLNVSKVQIFKNTSPIFCVSEIEYQLKYSNDEYTFKRPNEFGTKDLAKEIKLRNVQNLYNLKKDLFLNDFKILRENKIKKSYQNKIENILDDILNSEKKIEKNKNIINLNKRILNFCEKESSNEELNGLLLKDKLFKNDIFSITRKYLKSAKEKNELNKKLSNFIKDIKESLIQTYKDNEKVIEILKKIDEELLDDSNLKKYEDLFLESLLKLSDEKIKFYMQNYEEKIEYDAGHLIPGDVGGFIFSFYFHDNTNKNLIDKIAFNGYPQISYINRGFWIKMVLKFLYY